MKQTFLLISIILTLNLFSQNVDLKTKELHYYNAIQPKLQYEYLGYNNFCLGISNLRYDGDAITGLPWSFHGAFIDVGLVSKDVTKMFSSKIGYEYFFLFLGGRINLINYTDFKNNQSCIRPEIGLSLVSFLTITYGYNINLSKTDFLGVEGSVVSINIGYIIDK